MRLGGALSLLISLFVASPLLAEPPQSGFFSSAMGDMSSGRFSESWAGGAQGQIGNTVHAQSWAGVDQDPTSQPTEVRPWDQGNSQLEWAVTCPRLSEPPELIADNVDPFTGSGTREYRSVYSGGEFWLSRDGPWGDGTEDYTGILEYYEHYTTFIFAGGVPIAYTTNVDLRGQFDGYCRCLLVIANAASVASGPQPVAYPGFLLNNGTECYVHTGLLGEWGDVMDITLSVFDCASGSRSATWSTVKDFYK